MNGTTKQYDKLKEAVEKTAGRKMCTPRDFDFLVDRMSSFIQEPNIIINGGFKIVKPIVDNGATSLCFVVEIDGKQYFLKSLRPDLLNKSEYRILFKKEYELGQSVNHCNIVNYEQFCDDDHDCYI